MKSLNFVILAVFLALCALTKEVAAANGPVTRRGTSVLHYMTRGDLLSADGGSNVVGSLRLQFNEQGNSLKQNLLLTAALETNSSYGLIAAVGDDTNAVPVMTLTTDRRGRARLSLQARGLTASGGRNPLPDALSPLTDVRFIGIENMSIQLVAYSWIADAPQFQYLVKRNLTPTGTNGEAGSISLIANQRRVNFRLLAGGLTPTASYHLALNSNIVTDVISDANGRLDLKTWPTNGVPILDLRSLSVQDAVSNTVLSTTLPR